MDEVSQRVLKAAKEVMVKFIETGRVSPASYEETFKKVYSAMLESVRAGLEEPAAAEEDKKT